MNKNIINNSLIQKILTTGALAFSSDYISSSVDYDFKIFEKAYTGTGELYASVKSKIESGDCQDSSCQSEITFLQHLEDAPKKSLDFMSNLISQLTNVTKPNFDLNNDYRYNVAYCVMLSRPGFSRQDGYDVSLYLNKNGSQDLIFNGPALEQPLVINSNALYSLLGINQNIVSITPDIEKSMMSLLVQATLFLPESIDENEELKPSAKISNEFIITGSDGKPEYDVIEIENGFSRNILKYDLDKIQRKITPFVRAEVAGIMRFEQDTIAAWNVYFSEHKDYWLYEDNLPLSDDKKDEFFKKYMEYLMYNYIDKFTANKLPEDPADAAPFNSEENKKAKAQKFIDDNQL